MRRLGRLLGVTLLLSCQDTPRMTEVDGVSALATRTLTVLGSGTGDGTVRSSPAGISCTITNGAVGATGCRAPFSQGAGVTLTATPRSGHSFKGWLRSCSGTGTCTVTMSVNRNVEARFLEGPFRIRIAGGVGTGNGRVRSQAGLTPAINCVITNGAPGATGCSARYPAYTELVLTATPSAGNSSTWGPPCSGTGTCEHTVIQNRTIEAVFTPSGSPSAAARGQWGPTFQTPVVGIHGSLLPNGKVLFWGERGATHLWDPAHPGAGFTALSKTFQIFCSGHTFLPDGRLLIAGGKITGENGEPRAVIYDPASGSWSPTGSMARGRYYPTLTVLPNGRVLAVSGSDETGATVTIPELGDGSSWRRLTSAPLAISNPFYPAMFVAPNGRLFLAGFQGTTRYLSTSGDGQWTTVGNRVVADRRLGSAVMYAPGKILYAGGGDPPTSSAEVIDLNQASPAWRSVPGMRFARRQMNATILADGQVLVTNGTSGAGFNNVGAAVHEAELWNPATETWTTMTPEVAGRTYHSASLLLPDGRVLSTGSGEGGGVSYESSQFTGQVFSPPYLFASDGSPAERPVIGSAPSRITYGASFTVETPGAGTITRGTLIRLSSVTHAFNQSQVSYPLTFTPTSATTLRAAGPSAAALAPPGPYMLFLLSARGVPSMARMVLVGP
ncbi:MAG TPA: galactose oxidase-like domain-containing protein [Gemmatimonadales bacterium]|jgi:Periplasmic component of the Tol biopolymer transport system